MEGSEPTVKLYWSAMTIPEYPKIVCREYLPLVRSEVNMVSAGGGIGKTFIALTAGLFFVKENPGRNVFLWTTEDQPGLMKAREMAVVNKYLREGIDFRDAFPDICFGFDHEPFLQKGKNRDYEPSEYFVKAMDELCKSFALIVLDPLLNFFGGDNENDNHQARMFISEIKKAANKYETTFLIIHHGNKATGAFRGASAFQDSCRLAYEITTNEMNQMVAKMTKSNYTGKKGDIFLNPIPTSDMFPRPEERIYHNPPEAYHSEGPAPF